MNYAYYEGKGVEIREVIDLAETLPFFAERRLIVFENTGLFKSSGADLAEYIKTMPETTYFIFVEEEVDKRSKLYKAVKAKVIQGCFCPSIFFGTLLHQKRQHPP